MAWLQFIEAIEIYPVPVVVDVGSDKILELLLSYCFWKLYQVLTHLRLTLFCRSVPEAIKEIEGFEKCVSITRQMWAVFHHAYEAPGTFTFMD